MWCPHWTWGLPASQAMVSTLSSNPQCLAKANLQDRPLLGGLVVQPYWHFPFEFISGRNSLLTRNMALQSQQQRRKKLRQFSKKGLTTAAIHGHCCLKTAFGDIFFSKITVSVQSYHFHLSILTFIEKKSNSLSCEINQIKKLIKINKTIICIITHFNIKRSIPQALKMGSLEQNQGQRK